MATDLVALYVRILALVPVEELQDGYNAVLQEAILPLDNAVNAVTAAFAKLQEVGYAVNKLERTNGSASRRSESLMEAMDHTMKLHRGLKKKLELTTAAMPKSRRKEKRSLQSANGIEAKRLKTEVNGDEFLPASKRELEKSEKAKLELAKHAYLHSADETKTASSSWFNQLSKASFLEIMRMMTQLNVVERNKHIPGVLAKLASILPRRKEADQISIIKYVILWAHLSAGQGGCLVAFLLFSKAVTALVKRLPPSDGLVGMKRLNDSLHALVREQKPGEESAKPKGGVQLSYDLQVWRVNSMEPDQRSKHVQQVSALKEEIPLLPLAIKQQIEFSKAVKTVGQWARNDPRAPELLTLYGELAEQVRAYADKVGNFVIKSELHRKTEDDRRAELKCNKVHIVFTWSGTGSRYSHVVNWPRQSTDQLVISDIYESFLAAMRAYDIQVVDIGMKSPLQGLNDKLSHILHEVAHEMVSKPAPVQDKQPALEKLVQPEVRSEPDSAQKATHMQNKGDLTWLEPEQAIHESHKLNRTEVLGLSQTQIRTRIMKMSWCQ